MTGEGEDWKDIWALSLDRTVLEQALSNQGLVGEKVLTVEGT